MDAKDINSDIKFKKQQLKILCQLKNVKKYDVEKAKNDIIESMAVGKILIKDIKMKQSLEYEEFIDKLKTTLPYEILCNLSLDRLQDCISVKNDKSLSDNEKYVMYMLISNY